MFCSNILISQVFPCAFSTNFIRLQHSMLYIHIHRYICTDFHIMQKYYHHIHVQRCMYRLPAIYIDTIYIDTYTRIFILCINTISYTCIQMHIQVSIYIHRCYLYTQIHIHGRCYIHRHILMYTDTYRCTQTHRHIDTYRCYVYAQIHIDATYIHR